MKRRYQFVTYSPFDGWLYLVDTEDNQKEICRIRQVDFEDAIHLEGVKRRYA
jgi:hypothetical protein